MNKPSTRKSCYRRAYSVAEKLVLIKRLVDAKEKLTVSSLYDNPDNAGTIPSRRTLYRIFDNPKNHRIRDATAVQIENLLMILEQSESAVASKAALTGDFYAILSQLVSVSRVQNREFLDRYAGCYKCIRLTANSKEILVTHMQIRRRANDIPEFIHVEAIPDEAQGLPGRESRTIIHEGCVFAKHRRAIFVSPFHNLRQMTCIISSNPNHPTFSGLLLAFDAINVFPFATRIFVVKAPEIDWKEIVKSPDYGLFAREHEAYSDYLPYIINSSDDHSVLFPDTSV